MQSRARIALDFPNSRHSAENRHYSDLEFFNTIGQKPPFEQTSICRKCGSAVRIIASIEDPVVIRKILAHLDAKATHAGLLPQCRAPPGIECSSEA